jgi:hypothetical protein
MHLASKSAVLICERCEMLPAMAGAVVETPGQVLSAGRDTTARARTELVLRERRSFRERTIQRRSSSGS